MASQGSGCDVEENELDDAEMEEKDELGNLSGIANRRTPFRVGGFASEAGTSSSRNHHRFLDRSKVRILLCDGDEKSSREVSELLCKCSYQVVSVRTARQVINALNAQGSEIDIILSEVDLPVAKGFKMLKYIMRTKELRHIPIVMMSAKDEVSVVVKCLRLGVADYLVKPLRTNELLNLWIHMWRRRRMLDLAEKDIWSYDIDTLVSDMSDGNTNSTLVSDDTDDRSRTVLVEMVMSKRQEFDVRSKNSAVDVEPDKMSKLEFDVQEEDKSMSGRILSCPKKNELKVGKSSAFLTYVKSRSQMKNSADVPLQSRSNERDLVSYDEPGDSQVYQLPCFFPRTVTQNLVHPCPSLLWVPNQNKCLLPTCGHPFPARYN
ncbi:unnamed protein product [Spirodela intermedia]|uniref:Response regulatory domain-containing protein n=1 Tax=Spirodela intermedia TaxID=51605 RepID=A0A7I8JQP4_SPIIN|nr:unnamed protein product [Spirodela intermedia]CAA6672091.1 unnamed protein product [Spirodela intermedia]